MDIEKVEIFLNGTKLSLSYLENGFEIKIKKENGLQATAKLDKQAALSIARFLNTLEAIEISLMPKRTKTVAKVRDDVAVALQKHVRLKAANDSGMVQCFTCDNWYHWKVIQGGHFISRVHNSTKIIEENIKPQCQGCNGFRMKDSLFVMDFERRMIDFHGKDFVDELKVIARQPVKHVRGELEEMLKELRAKNADLERRLAA